MSGKNVSKQPDGHGGERTVLRNGDGRYSTGAPASSTAADPFGIDPDEARAIFWRERESERKQRRRDELVVQQSMEREHAKSDTARLRGIDPMVDARFNEVEQLHRRLETEDLNNFHREHLLNVARQMQQSAVATAEDVRRVRRKPEPTETGASPAPRRIRARIDGLLARLRRA